MLLINLDFHQNHATMIDSMRNVVRNIFSVGVILLSSFILSGCQNVLKKSENAGLQITTHASEASVYLNGEFIKKTPYTDRELKPGTYTVKIEPENKQFVSYETSVTVYPSTLAILDWTFAESPEKSGGVLYEMEPMKDKENVLLSIVSIPDSTIVHIDGNSEGFTPVLINDITPGSHQYEITLPSYLSQTETVELNAGYQMNITVKLAKDPKALELKTDAETNASNSAQASESAKTVGKTEESTSATPTPTKTSSSKNEVEPPYVEILETGTGWLRVRAEASGSSDELAKVDVGTKHTYYQTQDGWFQIEYEPGKKGWISGQFGKLVK